jgi:hypothetical protein
VTLGPVRVVYPDESYNPLVFQIEGVTVEKVFVVNARGDAIEIKSGDRLPDEFGEPVKLLIHPRE